MSGKCLMVGDSRMASIGVNHGLHPRSRVTDNGGTNDVVGQGEDGNYYYAAGGKDYNWFAANVSQIVQQAKQQDCDYVVINMGVNDWPNFLQKTAQGGGVDEAGAQQMAKKYLELAQQIENLSSKKVVFVTPYPLHGDYGQNKYNAAWDNSRDAINAGLERFNSYLKEGASEHDFGFIDIFTPINTPEYLNDESYWADGVHGKKKLNEVVTSLINKGLEGLQAQSQNRTTESDSNRNQTGQGSPETNDNAADGGSAPEVLYRLDQGRNIVPTEDMRSKGVVTNLTSRQKSNMSRWAERVGLSDDAVQGLIAKYGDNAYDLMLKAMMEPHSLVGYIGEARRSSRKTIELLLDLKEEKAQTLLSRYNLTGGVNTVAPTSTAPTKASGSPRQGNSTRSSENPPTQRASVGNASGGSVQTRNFTASSINFNDPTVIDAFVKRVMKVSGIKSRREAEDIVNHIIAMSKKHHVDPCLAFAVAETESNFKQGGRSGAGAIGIMQLMPKTAEGLGVDPTNWRQNIEGGIMYLAKNQKRYGGNYIHMLVAYNAGPGNLNKGRRAGLEGPALDKKTDRQCYAHTVIDKIDTYRKLAGGNTGIYAYYFGDQSINHYTVARSTGRRKKKKQSRRSNAPARQSGRGRA